MIDPSALQSFLTVLVGPFFVAIAAGALLDLFADVTR